MQTVYFDVPEGKATKTLKEAALQANVDIVFAGRLMKKVHTPAIQGEYIPQDVFDLMLDGTSFSIFQHEKSGVYIARKVAHSSLANVNSTKENTLALASSRKNSAEKGGFLSTQDRYDDVYSLSPFVVNSEAGNRLYSINQSSSGTRIVAVVKELPFSLDVLTMNYLDDFNLSDPSEAISSFANVGVANQNIGAGGGNITRGFEQWYALRDGFYRNGVIDKTLIDRVEVLKGPYAAIYGRGEPGGLVNYIPKTPVYGKNGGQVKLQLGQNNTYRVQAERNIAIGNRTAVLVAGSYFEREFDLEWSHERTKSIGAMVRHKATEKDEISFDFETTIRRNNRGHGAMVMRAATGGVYNGISLKAGQYLGDFAWDFINEYGWLNTRGPDFWNDRKIEQYTAKWTHQFSDAATLRVVYGNQDQLQPYSYPINASQAIRVDEDLNFVRWDSNGTGRFREINEGGRALNVDFTVNWDVGESRHITLLTFDKSFTDKDWLDLRTSHSDPEIAELEADSYQVHRFFRDNSIASRPEIYNVLRRLDFTRVKVDGLFLMHRAKFFDDKLMVMLGSRYDESESLFTAKENLADPDEITEESITTVSDFSYNLGLNYTVVPNWMVYASHSTSFNPKGNFFTNEGRKPMPNESGAGNEFGIRSSIINGQVDFGFSYYDIERSNIRIKNPNFDPDAIDPVSGYRNVPILGDLDHDGTPFTQERIDEIDAAYRNRVSTHIPGGVDFISGYEFFANGRINENISFRATWGTMDSVHKVRDEAYLVGQPFRKVPSWTYTFSGNYRFNENRLKGLTLGFNYKGQDGYRLEDRDPAKDRRWFHRADNLLDLKLFASYSWMADERDHKIVLSASNVLDRISVSRDGYLTDGRNLQASYTLSF